MKAMFSSRRIAFVLVMVLAVCAPVTVFAQKDGHPLKVMTRNLYQGTDYQEVIGVPPEEFFGDVDKLIADVKATKPAARMHAVAMEIAAEQPDIVALQEATTWYLGTTTPMSYGPQIDMLGMLTQNLKDMGLPYRIVVHQDGFGIGVKSDGSQLPPIESAAHQLIGTNMQLAILVREELFTSGFAVEDAKSGVFTDSLPMPFLIYEIPVLRTWAYIDVNDKGRKFRFVTLHPEAFHPGYLLKQVTELLAGPAKTSTPVIIAADFNIPANIVPLETETTDPQLWCFDMAYKSILAAGFEDAYKSMYPTKAGLTCCQDTNLANPTTKAYERIDLIFTKGAVPYGAKIVGGTPASMFEGVWPSDHAGLVGKIKVQ